jgi:hypothetical protein
MEVDFESSFYDKNYDSIDEISFSENSHSYTDGSFSDDVEIYEKSVNFREEYSWAAQILAEMHTSEPRQGYKRTSETHIRDLEEQPKTKRARDR